MPPTDLGFPLIAEQELKGLAPDLLLIFVCHYTLYTDTDTVPHTVMLSTHLKCLYLGSVLQYIPQPLLENIDFLLQ